MARCSTPFAAVLPTSGKAAASRRNAAWTTAPRVPFPGSPLPAGVTPLEVTMTKETYEEIGGYMDAIRTVDEIRATENTKIISLEH